MKQNTVYLIIAALFIAAGAYWYFSTQTGNQPPVAPTAANPAQSKFETLVGELQPITFSTDIFSDPRFTALVDITTSISPESSGRLDPLAPFAGGGLVSAAPVSVSAPATLGSSSSAPPPGGAATTSVPASSASGH